MRQFFRAIKFGVPVIFAMAAIWAVTENSINNAVERGVVREAANKAENWGMYLANRIPDLEQLAVTGIPTREQKQVIQEVREVGDIFRFKLFTSDGRLSMVSDDADLASPPGVASLADFEAFQVASTGAPVVDVFDGTNNPNRPDFYAEAYIPLMGSDGSVRAIVEVYVDQTTTRTYFEESFRDLSLFFMALFALVFAVPGLAFCLQRVFAERSRKTAEFLANFDPLTGLLNRREFVIQAERAIRQGNLSVVCYLDLDRFKSINDTYGHSAGDAFLAHVSQIIRKNSRGEDVLARFGGDEFVVAFQGIDMESAVHRMRKILTECSVEVEVRNAKVSGSISVGLAKVEAGETLEKALSNADLALYHAKSSGRNDFAVYGEEMGQELRRRHALEKRLRDATRNFDFSIHYQPLVDGSNQNLVGYEALLRLADTDGTSIPPTTFIPLAEELGLIEQIGAWTIKTATREMAALDDNKVLAINLSTDQFTSGELVNTVRDALNASDFPASRLELEITESLLLEDSPFIEMQIDTLKEMGVAIAMDDFGTGFSSLSYLWKYGFDRLKIDQSFVAALEENPERSREIIETVVMLGDRLDMKITAEGVENADQSELLTALGCDVLQGFLFGKAVPFVDLPSPSSNSSPASGIGGSSKQR
ncbi:MAG: EAL domain-containing protein [Paracoccaceae bacterium]|nr:EAL domain-containing protein [Paracoccaceae bacterium]